MTNKVEYTKEELGHNPILAKCAASPRDFTTTELTTLCGWQAQK